MNKMTSRERLIATLEHREPDRVPLGIWMTLDAYKNLRNHLGMTVKETYPPGSTTWSLDVHVEADVVEKLDLDICRISAGTPGDQGFRKTDEGIYIDEWAIKRRLIEFETGSYMEIVDPPLATATIEDLNDYPWPDPTDPGVWQNLELKTKFLYNETPFGILAQFGRGGIYEQAKYLRGHEQILMDMIINPDFVHALFNKLCEIEMKFNEIGIGLIGKYINLLRLSPEDLGTQDSMQMSPKLFTEMILPYYQRSFQFAKSLLKQQNPSARLQFHSCGAIYPIIGKLIEAGMEVADPLQPIAKGVEPSRLKQDFGHLLSWWGGIDVQQTLPFGSKADVIAEVRTRIKEMAPGGGYILSSSHRCQPDIPIENLLTMYEAAREFGKYPINL